MSAQPAARSSTAMTATLYALVVLIWGSTWIALKLQLGAVPVELSIAYRFALAAV
ncbi:MAG TPA: EamA family transporter, partial [Delftia acidovorans]|nr:EamA family transporter [Delftia acidovorans]